MNMPSLLVTGASRGLGLELCRQYSDAGWRVFACCRNPGTASRLAPIVDTAKGRVTLHRMDVDDAGEVEAVAGELEGTPIDILINNAGLADSYGSGVREGSDDPDLKNYDMADWLRILNTNVVSVGRVTGAFADHVAASDRKLIVMMASSLSSVGNTWQAGRYAYRTSKAALNMLMRGVGAWLEPRGVTVASVAPGWTRTELGGPNAHYGVEEAVERVIALLERLNIEDTGSFWNYDGERLPW
jgi:NAD(P)-dependent dehydrogenase (short-subunit alcohol dehydrogenase family)